MREIVRQSRFKTDLKRVARSGNHKLEDLLLVLTCLASDQPLAERCRDHALGGDWHDYRECHIKPDWLLVYRVEPGRLVLVRTGSHSELFG